LKRQKTTGPIITRYPPPPNHNSQPSLRRGFTHPPAGNQTYSIPNGLLTPLSANGQSHSSWNPQQNQYGSPAPRQTNQQWTSTAPPTPMSAYGPQYTSPVSTNGNTQHQNYFNPQPPSAANQTTPSGNPLPEAQPSTSFDPGAYAKPSIDSSKRQSISSDRTPVPGADGEKVEPWLEELQALDFEELKTGSGPISTHLKKPQ
jgi:hypothetical protein